LLIGASEGNFQATALGIDVEVAEPATAQSGRIAEGAVFFFARASTKGRKNLQHSNQPRKARGFCLTLSG
jgi:hypothetical protein